MSAIDKKPAIGTRYRHIERETTFTVVGHTYAEIWDKFDGETYWLLVRETKSRAVFKLTRSIRADLAKDVVLKLRATMQRATVRDGQRATDFVIYQAESDNTLWVRSLEEFTDGRFELLEK